MELEQFYGTTLKALKAPKDEKNRQPVSHLFFKPYGSLKNFAVKTMSIITDPVILASHSASLLIGAVSSLLKAMSQFLFFEFSKAAKEMKKCGRKLAYFPIILFFAVVSPLINLVDLGGSAVSTVQNSLSSKKENEHLHLEEGYP